LTAADRAALSGIGDPHLREAQDFFGEAPRGVVETANGRFSVGDPVEYTQPDGYRIAGRLDELSAGGAMVSIAQGEKALIPIEALEYPATATRRANKAAAIKDAIQGGGGAGCITETRAPLPVNESGRDFAITLQAYGSRQPSEADVMAYVAHKYPGASVLDADTTHPDKLGVIIHCPSGLSREAQYMVPVHAPDVAPQDHPESPGMHQELMEGTGKIGGDDESPSKEAQRRMELLDQTGQFLTAMAAANPRVDFVETSVETSIDGVVSHFAIHQGGAPMFLKASKDGAELTSVLSQGAAPAVGYIIAGSGALKCAIHGPKGELQPAKISGLSLVAQEAYSSMNSPATLHREDEPGAYETGSYATQAGVEADVDVEGAPPQSDPSQYYSKEQWEREMQRYQEEQQQQELQQQRRRQLRTQQPGQGDPMQRTYPSQYQQQPSQRPDWLEDAPLIEQVKGDLEEDGDSEHLGGPGLSVARVDQSTKDYYTGFYGSDGDGYGEMLTRDIPRRRRAREMLTAAFKQSGQKLTAQKLIKGMQILCSKTAQVDDPEGLFQSLLHSKQTDPGADKALDGLIADFLSRNPEALDQMGVYDQALRSALRYFEMMEPKRIEKIRKRYAPEQEAVGTEHQPGLFQRMREKLSPAQRMQREMDTGLWERSPLPEAPAAPEPAAPAPQAPAREEPLDLGLTPPEPEYIDLGEFGFDPTEAPAAAPAAPAKPKPKRQRKPKPKQTFSPTPEMKVLDVKGNPVPAPPQGFVMKKFDSGVVRYKTPEGQTYTAYPPGAPTPGQPQPQAPQQPAQQPGLGETVKGLGQEVGRGLKQRFFGGSRQATKPLGPQHSATNPTPGTYHDQSAADNFAGRRQPATAHMGFSLNNLRRRGDYVVGDVVWDTEATKAMSAGNVEHNIISFVKGRSTMKDPVDLGNIGRVRVKKLDVHAGVAEVVFRSSEARALPPEFIEREEGVIHHAPIA
jgi:hypothetical protein